MSLTTCLAKAGSALNPEDKRAILDRSRALRKEGKRALDSGRQAVEEQLAAVRGMLPAGDGEKSEAGKSEGKIDDFGEKLEGARKDYATSLKEAMSVDIAAEPLSKSWPEPDYQKMLDSGADPFMVAFIHAARDEVPSKPQKAWKLKGWVDAVNSLRSMAQSMLSGEVGKAKLQEMLLKGQFRNVRQSVGSRAELYELVGHAQSLKGVSFREHNYMLYRGQEDVHKWVVEQAAKATAFSNWPRELAVADTKAEMLAQFKAKMAAAPEATAKAKASFVIWRADGTYSVGKKLGTNYVTLKKVTDLKEARAYIADHSAELESALERYKQTPFERKAENDPRVGADHRNGARATPEAFADAFKFRGVQFGNWVEQGKRQNDLDQAFDSLMDLAAVVGIPSRALSLNGQLGLAFGSQGRGGKEAAAAHYNPATVVINLTKEHGAGSLAHEWFHSADNYFAKLSGGKGGMMTEGAVNPALRPEMAEAFKGIQKAIAASEMRKRSRELDKRKSKPYWSAYDEMAARAFEAYIIAKLQDQGAANDYLANIVSPDYWKAQEALMGHGEEATYPYPTQAEMGPIREAFDNFFKTVETRHDDAGNVALFDLKDPSTDLEDHIRMLPEVSFIGDAKQQDIDAVAKVEKLLRDTKDLSGLQMTALPSLEEPRANAHPLEQDRYAATKLAESFGQRVIWFSSNLQFAHGFHTSRVPGVVFINEQTTRPIMAVLGHETLHAMRNQSPELYDALRKRIQAVLKEQGAYAKQLNQRRASKGLEPLDPDKLEEELIGDIVGDNWTDPEFWGRMSQGQPGLFQRVLKSIKDFLDKLIGRLKNERPYGTDRYLKDVEAARDAVADAMREFAGQKTGAYYANEPDAPYTTDLFGAALPAGTDRPTKPGRRGVRGDAQPAATIRDTAAPAGEYLTRTIVGSEVQRKLGASVIKTPEDAAAATQYLYKSAVERFDGIVVDANGRPLAVIGGFKGAISQASVYPATLMGEAVRIPGASAVWFSHNHPSGVAALSRADEFLNGSLSEVFRGSGIEPMGTLAIGDGMFSHVGPSGVLSRTLSAIPKPKGETTVSAIERQMSDRAAGPEVSSPADAKAAAAKYHAASGSPGILLLNNQHGVIGWVPVTPPMTGMLRGTGGLNAIYRAVSEANASAALLVHAGEFDAGMPAGEHTIGQNIAAALSKVDVRPLDSINVKTQKSASEMGETISAAVMLSVDPQSTAFKKWFAGSKVVDAQGNPLVVYHGTNTTFSEFVSHSPQRVLRQDGKELRRVDSWEMGDDHTGQPDAYHYLALSDVESRQPKEALKTRSRELESLKRRNQDESFPDSERIVRDLQRLADGGQITKSVESRQTGVRPYFTPDKEYSFIRNAGVSEGGNVVPVYLSIKNPIYLDAAQIESAGWRWEKYAEQGYDGAIFAGNRNDISKRDLMGGSTQIVAFKPTQIKSAIGNKGTYDPKNPDITLSHPDEPFYSELAMQIARAPIKASMPDGWKQYLKSLIGKGVKADEIHWTGIEDYLGLQTGKVTKESLLGYLNENGVRVTETALTGGEAKFNRPDFVLPGGTNYREVLLTLPAKAPVVAELLSAADKARLAALAESDRNGELSPEERDELYDLRHQNRADIKAAEAARNAERKYVSGHWDQPNVLAHLRLNDRVDSEGRRTLFVEEVQADKGQAWKKLKTKIDKGTATEQEKERFEFLDKNFPFNKTDAWLSLSIKRIIKLAVDGNYERVAFINGEQSADRYGLIGGEGMRTFYDSIVPKVAKEVLKKIGGWPLIDVKFEAAGETLTQPGFAITTELQENAAGGLPMFSLTQQSLFHGWAMPKGTKFDNYVYKFQNKQIDLKRATDAIRKTASLEDRFDAYLQEELFHGRSAKRVEDFAERELRPLLVDMRARKVTQAELNKYLHARHAEEANNHIAKINPSMPDGGSGMTTGAADAYLTGLAPDVKKNLEALASQVDTIIAKTRDTYVNYGLESRATVDAWSASLGFKHYVPLFREHHDGGMGIGQGFSIRGRESKSRTGSTSEVSDILANIAMQRERAVVRGEKNRVSLALAGLVAANPNPEVWSLTDIPTEQVLGKDGMVETRIVPGWKSLDNVLVFKMPSKGEVKEGAVVFNEDNERAVRMAAALKNLDAEQLEGVIGVSAKVTRYFASINTQYNPVFGMVNLTRDLGGAAINLTSTPLNGKRAKVLFEAARFFAETAAAGFRMDGIKDKALWDEFQREGGKTGFRQMFQTAADRANAIKKELDPQYWQKEGVGRAFTLGGVLDKPLAGLQNTTGWLFDWLSDYNEALENVTRLAAYKVGVEQGLSKQQAASLAKNLTVNFNRKGAQAPLMGALYAFFNASMQGTARIGQTLFTMEGGDVKTMHLTKAGAAVIGGGILLGVLQALALAAAGFDDDEPERFVRERNLIIPINPGGKQHIIIPMPLGWHVLPNIGRLATELAISGGKGAGEKGAELFTIIVGAFNPLGSATIAQTASPTALDPLVAIVEDKDWAGRPIAKKSFDSTQPGYLNARDLASDLAKWAAKRLNYISGGTEFTAGALSPTPDQIDYLIGQVTGGVGRELSKANQTIRAIGSGEDLPPHKIPLVGRFYGNASANQSSRFYSNLTRMREHKAELEGLSESGREAEVQRYLDDHPEAAMFKAAEGASKQISKLRASKRRLLEQGAYPQQIKDVEKATTDAMREFNDAVEKAQKSKAR